MTRLSFFASVAACALLSACDIPSGAGAPYSAASDLAASPVVEPALAEAAFDASPVRATGNAGFPRAGVVTAGDIDDGRNFAAFQRYLARASADHGLPQARFGAPVMAQVTGWRGLPEPGVRYTLRLPGAADPFYEGYSGVDGQVMVFPAALGAGNPAKVELRAFPDTGGMVTQTLTPGRRDRVEVYTRTGWQPDFLDLVLVVDTTGSMGDELAWLTRELSGVIDAARASAPGVDIRYGLVVYRDIGDDYVVRNFGFTANQARMRGWLAAQRADGGGDYPEAAADALAGAMALDWRRGKGERLVLHVADAPPHQGDMRAYLAQAERAAAQGVQIFTLGASGVGPQAEAMMRQASVLTNGRYLFLTDDSGVGLDHGEPTVPCYRVTRLTGLMSRVLASELTGRRIEAGAGDVLREVGTYQAGICRD